MLQYPVRDPSGRLVARVDLAYPEVRVAVELNGLRWHGTLGATPATRTRSRRLASLGWLVLPATPVELAGPGDGLAGEVAAATEHVRAGRACG